MPTVSVLVPTYKPKEQHLTETLESLRAQTETDWECIICDEPTEVDTHAMVMDYLVDERFRFYKNEKCLGIGGNWNRCLSKARSDVVAYLFQDDLWEPDYLETALNIFSSHHNVGMISMNHRYQYDEDLWTADGYEVLQNIKEEVLREGMWNREEFLTMWLKRSMHPNLIGEPPFVVLRKDVMEKVGPFHEQMPQFLDVEYWLRCLQVTDWYYEKKIHGSFRIHGDAASFRNNESGQGLYDRLTCYSILIDALDGNMKKLAIQSRNKSVEDMAYKFLYRVKKGKGVSAKGGGQVVRFVLRHPLIVSMGFARALWRRITKTPSSTHSHP